MKKKNFSLIYICIALLIIIAICIFVFITSYRRLKGDVKESVSNLYASVLETGKNYIKIKDTNSTDVYYLKYNKGNINTNDIILIKYKDTVDNYEKIEVIVDSSDEVFMEDIKTTTSIPTTIKRTSTITVTKSTTSTEATKEFNSDDEIIKEVKESYNLINSSNEKSFGDKLKDKFITIVDFIFYGTEINGRTFKSLTTSAKGQVIYYALLIDSKIESKWPQYKENISEKYKDIKAKLLANYLDLTTKACKSNEHACEVLKKDFKTLKSSLKITWDLVKSAFSYAYDKTSSAIVEWYSVFSGKV